MEDPALLRMKSYKKTRDKSSSTEQNFSHYSSATCIYPVYFFTPIVWCSSASITKATCLAPVTDLDPGLVLH